MTKPLVVSSTIPASRGDLMFYPFTRYCRDLSISPHRRSISPRKAGPGKSVLAVPAAPSALDEWRGTRRGLKAGVAVVGNVSSALADNIRSARSKAKAIRDLDPLEPG